MKLHSNLTISGKLFEKGSEVPAYKIYSFFLLHMAIFGFSGFLLAYGDNHAPVVFRYFHGLFAILIYVAFYVSIFGLEEVKWMFINGGLGILGTYAQIDWILSLFGKDIRSYSMIRHLIPSLYLILYTFLLYNALLDFSGARENPEKKRRVEIFYVLGSALLYGGYYFYSGFGVKS